MIVQKEQIASLDKLFVDSKEDTCNIEVDDILATDLTLLVNIGVDKYKIEPSGKVLLQDWSEVELD